MLKLVSALDMTFESVIDYYNSFKNKNEVNSFTIRSIEDGKAEYFALVTHSYENIYYLIDDNKPEFIIGFGSIENSGLRDYHSPLHNDGNISYGVRPSERNKGYGTILLKLLLEKCKELEMNEVCISCTEDNIASKRVIEKNNGSFDGSFLDNWHNKPALKYWISIEPELISSKRKC